MKWNDKKAKLYLEKNGVLNLLENTQKGQLVPQYADLARLHQLVTSRRVFTILEFGVGFSTIVLAHALAQNKKTWEKAKIDMDFRVAYPFKVFSVDSSQKWMQVVKKMIPVELREYVEISYSPVEAGLFNGRMCHFYKTLPDVIPDFIYLDAPDPLDVANSVNGMSWKNKERTVMSGDVLPMEPMLLPRTLILVDGRTNNVRFLQNNLQRNWKIHHDVEGDVTTLELDEAPLGKINKAKIEYCLKK